jgi:hypothetical protein
VTTPWHNATWWLDEDGKHVWQSHDCVKGRVTSMLPWSKWSMKDGTVTPSVVCELCGMHVILTDAFRIAPEVP